jgi:hypothetical protein
MKKLIAVGHWSSSVFGTKADGEIFSVADEQADTLVQRGYAREYSVKPHPITAKKILPESASTLSPADQPAQAPKKSRKPRTKAK